MTDSHDVKNSPSAPVTIESGLLSGVHLPETNTRAFLGIPYAAPPVGDLRWRPPQPPLPWIGVRPAEKLGPSSLQVPPPSKSLYYGGETEFSEDCLYLNIYTGASEGETRITRERPVLVWFHFGAFSFGSASNPMYDGSKLAAQGIAVVTVNYRLGRFGFLAHPQLSAESSGYRTSGNYGILDQIAALQWVQRNIKAFGGDPASVTIGGASAGGGSVHILRASPLAKSLFTRAICESGPGLAPAVEGHGHVAAYSTLAAAEQAGAELLDMIGVSSVSELRKLHAGQILAPQLPRIQGPWKSDLWPFSTSLSGFDTVTPVIDGHVLPESPLAAFISANVADTPLLAGNVGNEASGLPFLDSLADYHTFVNDTFREYAQEALRVYPATTDTEVRASTSELLADQCFVWPTWTSARLQAKNLKSSTWYYRFLREPPILSTSDLIERKTAGAFHVAGVPYAFQNLDSWQKSWDWTHADRALSKKISEALVRFVRTGNPNNDSQEHNCDDSWPALKSNGDLIKIWDGESRFEKLGSNIDEKMAFWDRFYGVEEEVAI